MKLEVIGKGVAVTDAMRNYAADKLDRLSTLFASDTNLNAVVIYKVHPKTSEQSCEVTITSPRITLRAKTRGTIAYECLDLCIDKLAGQLRKAKTQFEKSRQKDVLADLSSSLDDEETPEDVEVVKVKKLDLVPMDAEEAIARMDALGHSFFVYLDASTGLVNVLYARDDGGFGRIELERQ